MAYQLMLKSIRQSRNISQELMAELMGMKLSTYRSWEQGVSRISLENAWHICEILGCSPNDLSGWYLDHPREHRPSADGMTPDESRTLAKYRALTISAQQAANAMLDGLGAQSKASAEGSTAYKEAAQG